MIHCVFVGVIYFHWRADARPLAKSFWLAYRLPWFTAAATFDRGFDASGNKLGTKNVNKPFRTLSVA